MCTQRHRPTDPAQLRWSMSGRTRPTDRPCFDPPRAARRKFLGSDTSDRPTRTGALAQGPQWVTKEQEHTNRTHRVRDRRKGRAERKRIDPSVQNSRKLAVATHAHCMRVTVRNDSARLRPVRARVPAEARQLSTDRDPTETRQSPTDLDRPRARARGCGLWGTAQR